MSIWGLELKYGYSNLISSITFCDFIIKRSINLKEINEISSDQDESPLNQVSPYFAIAPELSDNIFKQFKLNDLNELVENEVLFLLYRA